jgi:hypothetical protein
MAGPPGSMDWWATKPCNAGDYADRTSDLSGPGLSGRDMTDVLGSLRMPRVVGGLHPRPDSRAIAKRLAEPNRDGWRYRFLSCRMS